jgi:hypothetical protein
MIGRRDFITLLGGAAAWPLAAWAQTANVQKVGFLYPGPLAAAKTRIPPFLEGLRLPGFRVPQEVEVLSQIADGDPARLSPLAAATGAVLAPLIPAALARGLSNPSPLMPRSALA